MFRLLTRNVEDLEEKEAQDIIQRAERIATYARGIRGITNIIRKGKISKAADLKYYNTEVKELIKALTNEVLLAYHESRKIGHQDKKRVKRKVESAFPCPQCGKPCDHVISPHAEVISCDHCGYDHVERK